MLHYHPSSFVFNSSSSPSQLDKVPQACVHIKTKELGEESPEHFLTRCLMPLNLNLVPRPFCPTMKHHPSSYQEPWQ